MLKFQGRHDWREGVFEPSNRNNVKYDFVCMYIPN